MTDYRPPLEDQRFVLEHVADLAGLAELPGFEHADVATVSALLEEAGRFFAEQFGPLNRVGDVQHSRRNEDGSVSTPEGFGKAYRRYVEAGWPAVPFPAEYGGGGFPWLVAVAMQEMMTAANMGFSLLPRHRAPSTCSCTTAARRSARCTSPRWSPASGRGR
jgi:alkylation response protein AidB-like acyl-CoA dehydrogenase